MGVRIKSRRTRLALVFRIVCAIGIPATYLLIAAATRGVHIGQHGDVEPVAVAVGGGRHLLGRAEELGRNCTPAAIFEFPSDGFTRTQRQRGYVIVHAVIACYCFVLLAVVCDDYFVPAIKKMCKALSMTEDVAGATFMAAASSSPELFINCVGTFVTEGDLGVGTIVGSAVFNVLAVPACCGLIANQRVQLDWWPVSRDSLMYGLSVISLIAVLSDGRVEWYEALALVSAYVFYITAMYFNEEIGGFVKRTVKRASGRTTYTDISEVRPLLVKEDKCTNNNNGSISVKPDDSAASTSNHHEEPDEDDEAVDIWSFPAKSVSFWGRLFWYLTWPISFILYCTIPDCRTRPRLVVVTFFLCIFWIGTTSYMTAWLITVLGDTIDIPDSVMGLTFLAAGTSVPEAVSSVIVTNQGFGSMGVSNSIGSNTFDILLCLGLPWLIKSTFLPLVPGKHFVQINSSGLAYSAISLFSTLVLLYTSFACNRFVLDWKIGLTCLLMYIGFLAFASLIELNYFFPVNLPTCDRGQF